MKKVMFAAAVAAAGLAFGIECAEIKPLVRSMTEQPVVQVTPVNIHDCPLVCYKKVLRSWRTRTPRRLPESRRVKRPVIGGVGKCIKIRAVSQ